MLVLLTLTGSVALADGPAWGNMFGYDESSYSRGARPKARPTARKAAPKKASKTAVKPAAKPADKPAPKPTVKPSEPATPPATTAKVQIPPAVANEKLARFVHVDPQGKIAKTPLMHALMAYASNQHTLENSRYLGVIDFSKHSREARFCIITMKTGETECVKTSHGAGSDRKRSGWATSFSNRYHSNASSVGYYKTLNTYSGKHGTSLRMDGQSATNSNALGRSVVIHPAISRRGTAYVNDAHRGGSGLSHGCPALDPRKAQRLIAQLKGGALIYAWHPKHMGTPAK